MKRHTGKLLPRVCSNCVHFGAGGTERRHQGKCSLTGLQVLPIMKGCPMFSLSGSRRSTPAKTYSVQLVVDAIENCKGDS